MYRLNHPAKEVPIGTPTLAERFVILRTNIVSKIAVHRVSNAFLALPQVRAVSIDLEDVDHVMRLDTNGKLSLEEAIYRLCRMGFWGEDLEK
ncbi:MAG: hypothetical protein AAF433_18050 [Bacteroidota bacterium]